MMKKIQLIFLSIALIAHTSCSSTNFEVYYNSEVVPPECYEPLSIDANPQVLEVYDLDSAMKRYLSSGYIMLGSMNFVGARATQSEIANFAKTKASSLVIFSSHQKGTKMRSYLMPHSTSSTSRSSGATSHTNDMSALKSVDDTARKTPSSTQWHERSYELGVYEHVSIFLAKKR